MRTATSSGRRQPHVRRANVRISADAHVHCRICRGSSVRRPRNGRTNDSPDVLWDSHGISWPHQPGVRGTTRIRPTPRYRRAKAVSLANHIEDQENPTVISQGADGSVLAASAPLATPPRMAKGTHQLCVQKLRHTCRDTSAAEPSPTPARTQRLPCRSAPVPCGHEPPGLALRRLRAGEQGSLVGTHNPRKAATCSRPGRGDCPPNGVSGLTRRQLSAGRLVTDDRDNQGRELDAQGCEEEDVVVDGVGP